MGTVTRDCAVIELGDGASSVEPMMMGSSRLSPASEIIRFDGSSAAGAAAARGLLVVAAPAGRMRR